MLLLHFPYPCYISVCKPQDPLPVGPIDEEAIRLSDCSDVGAQRGIGAVGDWHQVGAQLSFPATLGVGNVHTPAQVTVGTGAADREGDNVFVTFN